MFTRCAAERPSPRRGVTSWPAAECHHLAGLIHVVDDPEQARIAQRDPEGHPRPRVAEGNVNGGAGVRIGPAIEVPAAAHAALRERGAGIGPFLDPPPNERSGPLLRFPGGVGGPGTTGPRNGAENASSSAVTSAIPAGSA